MRRIWLVVGTIVFVLSLAIGPALAQESTKPPVPRPQPEKKPEPKAEKPAQPEKAPEKPAKAPEKPAEEPAVDPEAPEEELEPVTGEKVEIRLREGDVIRGVVKGARAELLSPSGRFVPAKNREVEGAGIRVYYAMGLNGFLFVPYNTIEDLSFRGALSESEGIDIARRIASERRRSEADRIRAVQELEAKKRAAAEKKAAEEAAAAEGAEGEEAPAEKGPAKPVAAKGAEEAPQSDADRAAKVRELLKRFPPSEWKPSRLAEIKDRNLILNIKPTAEERVFMENYALWLEGYEIWRKEKTSARR